MVADFLRTDASITVNKRLARLIGLDETILFCELLSKHAYYLKRGQLTDEGFFFCTIENLKEDTTLSRHQQDKAIDLLVILDLIEVQIKGMPARRYFKVAQEVEKLEKVLKKNPKDIIGIKKQLAEKRQTSKQKSDTKIDNNLQTSLRKSDKLVCEKVTGNNTKINNTNLIILSNNNGIASGESLPDNSVDNLVDFMEVSNCIIYYRKKFYEFTGREHRQFTPKYYAKLHNKIIAKLKEIYAEYHHWEGMVDCYFATKFTKDTDWDIEHFLSGNIMNLKAYEAERMAE